MLRQAQEVMDKGLMTPEELEAHLLAHLSVRCSYSFRHPYASPAVHAMKTREGANSPRTGHVSTCQVAFAPFSHWSSTMEQLVHALNEHVRGVCH